MSPVLPLDRTILQMLDFREQPITSHLVFPPSGDRTPVAIDSWKVRDYIFLGYVAGSSDPVVALAADSGWVVYARSLVRMLRTEDAMREGVARSHAMQRMEKELYGEHPATSEVVVLDTAAPASTELMPVESPGQYL
mgnify:CR=1 FL=1